MLRLPLLAKILIANSAIVALGAVVGTIATVWHVHMFPDDVHYELIGVFAAAGLLLSSVINYVLLKLALSPLDRLQAGVDAVRQGRLEARVSPGPLSDERFDRLFATFNAMLQRLQDDAEELHRLSGEILQAQEEERRRVARDLHDEAAQALTSLLVRLRLLERSATPEEARGQVQELRKLTAQALEEVRRVALELRPTILDDLGLEAALAWRVDEFNADQAARATLTMNGVDGRLPQPVELVFYRVAQEALNNVARHAHASQVALTLRREGNWLMLEVTDNGVGFAVPTASLDRRSGLGLVGMRERLMLLGGDLTLHSQPGQGTRVVARAPLTPTPGRLGPRGATEGAGLGDPIGMVIPQEPGQ